AVVLPSAGLEGTLVGGHNGLVLTHFGGRFVVAREADFFGALLGATREQTGAVSGLALIPGSKSGDIEVWAALQGKGPTPIDSSDGRGNGAEGASGQYNDAANTLIHYTSDPGDPLLVPDARVRSLP